MPIRIITGERRGHHLEGPRNTRLTRPTRDWVREAIFNILGDLVVDRDVLDLFAGTGAMGLEALSRGAARATFVECDRDNAQLIKLNAGLLRYRDVCQVYCTNVYRFFRTFALPSANPVVVFLDPPYLEYLNHPERMRELLEQMQQRLPAGSWILLEAPSRIPVEAVFPDPARWEFRRYGSTQIALWPADETGRLETETETATTSGDDPLESDESDTDAPETRGESASGQLD